MLSKRWQGLVVLAFAITLTLAFALPAQAQRDVGTMVVRVMDPDGAPLPGVMVVSRGPVGTQTQYTGIDGSARFPGLYPGSGYTATFTLDGFKTVIREDIVIPVVDLLLLLLAAEALRSLEAPNDLRLYANTRDSTAAPQLAGTHTSTDEISRGLDSLIRPPMNVVPMP